MRITPETSLRKPPADELGFVLAHEFGGGGGGKKKKAPKPKKPKKSKKKPQQQAVPVAHEPALPHFDFESFYASLPVPEAPEPPRPPDPATETRDEVVQAETDKKRQIRRRKGFRASRYAGNTGGLKGSGAAAK